MHTVHTYRLWEHAHCAHSWSVNYFPGRNCSGLHVSDHYKIAAIDPQYEFTGQGAECYVFQQDVSNDTSTGQTTKEAPESVEGMDFDFSAKKKKKKKKKVCTCTVCCLSLSHQPPPPPPPPPVNMSLVFECLLQNRLNRTQYSVVQCSTVQYSTVQYSSIEDSDDTVIPLFSALCLPRVSLALCSG